MVFTYLNNQDVWNSFCGSYEAIYNLLGDFDTWYANNGAAVAIPNLQNEWKQYIRDTLDSMVRRSRATFDYMYQNRRYVYHSRLTGNNKRIRYILRDANDDCPWRTKFLPILIIPYSFHWYNYRLINRQLIRLSLTCNNMNPSSA